MMWMKWLLLLTFSFPAWGYKLTPDFLNGFYWASLPIGITVVESDPQRKNKLETLAQMAIQEWESRTGHMLWDFSKSGSSPSSSNVIRWSNDFANETHMDPSSVLAVAIRYTNGPYFARTEIVINGSHNLNNYDNYLQTTITHELGHTMGLDHSDVSTAVMAPSLQLQYRGLQTDDLHAMSDAYSETHHRQVIGYVSPLAYETKESKSQPLSCGTTSMGSGFNAQALLSLSTGLLIGFVRKIWTWFKSLL